VSRKKKGSANRKNAASRLGRCHRRLAAIRRDFLHRATTGLARAHALIAARDLVVKNMTASAAGTLEAPGRNVPAKAGLNRAILRHSRAMARQMLECKAAWGGAALVAAPPAYASQECSACGRIAADNRKTQSAFGCVACGHTEHVDRNASKVILRRGQEMVSGGRPASTARYAGTRACEDGRPAPPRPRPRPAAPARPAGLAAAGTVSELRLCGKLHP
jgi:putative transposase